MKVNLKIEIEYAESFREDVDELVGNITNGEWSKAMIRDYGDKGLLTFNVSIDEDI